MTDSINAMPTTTELLALTSLLPGPGSAPFDPPSLLPHVLSIFGTSWLRDFLFSSSPMHLPFLHSPDIRSSAFLLSVTTTRVEPPSQQPDPYTPHGESQHASSHLLFTPAFTADSLTLGFGVMSGYNSLLAPWASHIDPVQESLRINFRFVRDASKQSLLLVCDLPHLDAVTVFCSRRTSRSNIHNFTASFRCAQLLNALDGEASEDEVQKAVHFMINEVRTRACHLCAIDKTGHCRCKLSMPRPEHPFDAQHFREGFQQTLGTYEGVACKVVRKGGGRERQVALGVRVSLGFSTDAGLVETLSRWSVSEHLRGTTEDPRLSNMLTMSEPPMIDYLLEDLPPDMGFDASPWTSERDPVIVVDDDGNDVTERRDRTCPTRGVPSPPSLPTGRSGSSIASCSASDSLVAELEPEQCNGISAENIQELATTTTPGTVLPSRGDAWWDTRCNRSLSRLCSDPCEPPDKESSGSKLLSTPASPSPTGDLVHSSALAPQCPLREGHVKKHRDDVKALQQLKRTEQRRERNRASAQRSNMRRKEEKDAIKLELRILHERIDILRRREVLLRQENLLLRGC